MNAPAKSNLALVKTDIIDKIQSTVGQYVQKGELNLPADYSPGNALKSAFLILQETVDKDKKPVLEVCTKTSIHNALYNMVVQGLNPEKKQGYFLPYGNKLAWQRSYFGNMALAKRVDPSIGDIVPEVVYKGDKLRYKIVKGRKQISDHEQDFDTESTQQDREIVAAYCLILDKSDEVIKTEFMTISEIHQSWKQSRQNPFDNNGKLRENTVHAKFTADMCKRTVINRACKPIINSSNDSAILREAIRQSSEDAAIAENDTVYEEEANRGPVIDIDAEEVIEDLASDGSAENETKDTPVSTEETGELSPRFTLLVKQLEKAEDSTALQKWKVSVQANIDANLNDIEKSELDRMFMERLNKLQSAEADQALGDQDQGGQRKPPFME